MSRNYVVCDERTIPSSVLWSVPGPNQGQMVEIAYGTLDRSEGGPGDQYKRRTDERRVVTYYRRRKPVPTTTQLDSDGDAHVMVPCRREEANEGVNNQWWRLALVRDDGSVLGWDPIAEAYTRHHGMTIEQQAKARELAGF